MNTCTRRRFLADVSASAATAGLVSLVGSTPLFLCESAAAAETKGETILVVVQLSGGNDGLNTIIPFKDDRYYKARPSLALNGANVIQLQDDLGLHLALRGFAKLWEASQLAIVQGVGYPNPNRSHFESMDIWHTAQLKPSDRTTGWLGRTFDRLKLAHPEQSAPALHLGGEELPLALAARDVPLPSITSLDQFLLDTNQNELHRQAIESAMVAPRPDANELLKFVATRSTAALELAHHLQQRAKDYATNVKYPASPLAGKLKQVAQLIDAGLESRVYYVTLDGFDTHSDQAPVHANLLQQLGDALAAFTEDLQLHGHGDRVATLVFSEFGRRVQENSSRGTDHGAAAPVFVIGNQVKAGIIGPHPRLDDLDEGDLKFHTDFRAVYASLLTTWLKWPAQPALGEAIKPLELFRA